MASSSLEVEVKYHVDKPDQLEQLLLAENFLLVETQQQEDIYLRHPCREFSKTDEAFRIRRVNDRACFTYKGPRMPGPVKTREEIELSIDHSQLDQWLMMMERLGFQPVIPVRKLRRVFECKSANYQQLCVALDQVEQVGSFAEIEIVITDRSELVAAESRVIELANKLGLNQLQPKSYLSMLLANQPH